MELKPFKTEETSEVLIVSFAGVGMDVAIGPEFQNTLQDSPHDQLFVIDPFVCWYMQDRDEKWKGFEYFQDALSHQIEK